MKQNGSLRNEDEWLYHGGNGIVLNENNIKVPAFGEVGHDKYRTPCWAARSHLKCFFCANINPAPI